MMTSERNNTAHTFSYDGLRAAYKFARMLSKPAKHTVQELFARAEENWRPNPALHQGLGEVHKLLASHPHVWRQPYAAKCVLMSAVNETIDSARTINAHFRLAMEALVLTLPREEKDIRLLQTALVTAPATAREKLGRILPAPQATVALPCVEQQDIKLRALYLTRKIAGMQSLTY